MEKAELPSSWKVKPQFLTDGESCRFTIPLEEGTSVYGTGEVRGSLERTGKSVILWNSDSGGYNKDGGRRLYQSHPWIMCVRKDGSSYGVLIDTTYRCRIDIEDAITFSSDAPGYRVIVIENDSPQNVVKDLAKLTGTMELPPMWAIGFQQCRWSYNPDTKVQAIADGMRKH
jgi:alpha-glucosidase